MPGEKLFEDKSDYEEYLKLLKENKSQFKLFSFLLLPDKISLLLELKSDSSLSQIMHNLNNSYTKYFNGKYGNRPHLFKGRYESKIIEKTYLLKLVNYFNFQSVIASERSNLFPFYSSYSIYVNKENLLPMKDEIDEVLNYVDGNYENYIKNIYEGEIKKIENLLAKKRIIGSKEFKDMVREKITFYKQNNVAIEVKPEENIPKIQIFPRKFAYLILTAFVIVIAVFSYFTYKAQRTIKFVQIQMQLAQKKLEDAEKGINLAQLSPSPKSFSLKGEEMSGRKNFVKERDISEEDKTIDKKFVDYDEKPVSLKYLEGTIWEVEIKVSNKETVNDKLIFNNKKFSSQKFNEKGFSPTNYSVRYKDNGIMVWETIQTDQKGETISWYGEFDGNVIKGILYQKSGNEEKSSSFISVKKAGIS